MTETLRVVVWSTGTVGRHAIAGIDRHPALDLVGVWVSSPAKDGQDAGRLAGLDRDLGVRATNDREALLALRPDCIVHCAMTDDRTFDAIEDLTAFVEQGVNVVSSGPVLLQFPHGILPPEMIERIDRAPASLHVNGIDPGWANDVLPLQLTSLSQRIDEVRVLEIADYSTYYQPVVMRDIFGFGDAVDAEKMLRQPGVLSMAWGGVVRQIAAGLDLVQAALDEFGRLDTVVNNVGGAMPKEFVRTNLQTMEDAFHFNVSTAHALTRSALPHLLQGDGEKSVVTISSMLGRTAGRGYVAYGTAKAALAHWTRLTAADLAPRIRVNGIFVGSIMTSALDVVAELPDLKDQMETRTPLGRIGEPDDIAAAVLYLASPASAYVTGKMLEVDGGIQEPNLDLGLPDLG